MLSALAPGKINLALLVGPVRPDGLHELVSLVQSLSLADELTLEDAPAGTPADTVECQGVEGPNLVATALRAYREHAGWDAPPQHVRVVKRVPVAGGMGGGSADAAAALRLAAHAAGRHDAAELGELAFGLGADVPALLAPGLALLAGAGETIERLPDPVTYGVLVLPRDVPLSTPEVFAKADALGHNRSADELAERRAALEAALAGGELPDGELLVNDLQAAAVELCPAIGEALDAIAGAGAGHAGVTGSGPTAFGLFAGAEGPAQAAAAAAELAADFPGACAAVPVDAAFAGVREGEGEAAA
jgi:4-diphosphocytidyl-2-C-methyl-D-erythritol kinase